MIGGLVAVLAGSAWARTAVRYGVTVLAILLFLLALRRSGEHVRDVGAAVKDAEAEEREVKRLRSEIRDAEELLAETRAKVPKLEPKSEAEPFARQARLFSLLHHRR